MDTQDQTFELTLKLTLPGKTLKKLKSYAMLSGISVDELEQQLVNQVQPELSARFDNVLTNSIVEKLSELDGVELGRIEERARAAPAVEEGDHQLSADDDTEEVKSLAEQVEADPSFPINVPNAGNNAEAFLDGALAAAGKRPAQAQGASTGTSSAFDPRKPRVRISEHTGEEA